MSVSDPLRALPRTQKFITAILSDFVITSVKVRQQFLQVDANKVLRIDNVSFHLLIGYASHFATLLTIIFHGCFLNGRSLHHPNRRETKKGKAVEY